MGGGILSACVSPERADADIGPSTPSLFQKKAENTIQADLQPSVPNSVARRPLQSRQEAQVLRQGAFDWRREDWAIAIWVDGLQAFGLQKNRDLPLSG
jgi:hypothetical protein